MRKHIIWLFNYLLIISSFLIAHPVQDDTTGTSYFKIVDSHITISGTSSVRDWTVTTSTVSEFGGSKSILKLFTDNPYNLLILDEALAGSFLRFPVKKLDSGIRIMNQTMLEHLKEEQHPEIGYKILGISNAESDTYREGCYLLTIFAAADAAGVFHEIEHDVSMCLYNLKGNDNSHRKKIRLSGELELKMTDFGIDTPTFMGGTLKTGDAIQVGYDLKLELPHNGN